MRQRTAARLAWGILAFIVASAVVSITLAIAGEHYDVFFLADLAIFPVVGVVLASRRPSNPLGWIMLGMEFRSTPGSGTTVTGTIPLDAAATRTGAAAAASEQGAP